MKRALFNALFSAVLVSAPALANSASLITPVMAKVGQDFTIENGVGTSNANGDSKIEIVSDKISLANTQFKLFQLFDAKAVGEDGFVYNINSDYETEIKKAVFNSPNFEEHVTKHGAKPASANLLSKEQVIEYFESVSGDPADITTPVVQDSDYRKFLDSLYKEISASENATVITVTSADPSGKITIDSLPAGYYVIFETTAEKTAQDRALSTVMAGTIDATHPMQRKIKASAPISVKDDENGTDEPGEPNGPQGHHGGPDVDQSSKGDGRNTADPYGKTKGEANDFEIDETIPFVYNQKLPDMSGYLDGYQIVVHDKMDEGMVLEGDPVVKLVTKDGDTTVTLTPSTDYTLDKEPSDDETFTITIEDIKELVNTTKAGELGTTENIYLVVEYNGKLDGSVTTLESTGFDNVAWLEYSSDPNGDKETMARTADDHVLTYTYEVDLKKVAAGTSTNLSGATFNLYRKSGEVDQVKFTKNGDTYVVDADGTDTDITTTVDNPCKIVGLDEGDYYLKEEAAPATYARLDNEIKVTITPTFQQYNEVKDSGGVAAITNLAGKAEWKDYYGQLQTFTDDNGANITNLSMDITIPNESADKIAATGSNTGLILVIAAGGLFAGSFLLRKREQ